MSVKHMIWSNDCDTIQSIMDDYNREYADEIADGELNPMDWEMACETSGEYLDDERRNLDIDTDTEIIAIADLGLWDGRFSGYKMLGDNIKNCLSSYCDAVAEWYCDSYNFRATMHHHDGTNYILYRARKAHISEASWERFLHKIWNGTYTRNDIVKYTRSLQPDIAKVYGWKYREYEHTNHYEARKKNEQNTIYKEAA